MPDSFEEKLQELKENKLTTIVLTDSIFCKNQQQLESFIDALFEVSKKPDCKLEAIEIKFYEINETLAVKLNETLKKLPKLKNLYLNSGITKFSDVSTAMPLILKDLSIVSFGLLIDDCHHLRDSRGKSYEAIAHAIRDLKNLTSLNLGYNNAGDMFLSKLLPLPATLRVVNLRHNEIDDLLLEKLFKDSMNGRCQLVDLNIERSAKFGNKGANILLQLVATNTSLCSIAFDRWADSDKKVIAAIEKYRAENSALAGITDKNKRAAQLWKMINSRRDNGIELDLTAQCWHEATENITAQFAVFIQDYIDDVADMADPAEAIELLQQIMKPDASDKMLFNNGKKSVFCLRQIYCEDERSYWRLDDNTQPLYDNNTIPDVTKNQSAFLAVRNGLLRYMPQLAPSDIKNATRNLIQEKIMGLQQKLDGQKQMKIELERLKARIAELEKQQTKTPDATESSSTSTYSEKSTRPVFSL